jgi:hypothetical protein
MRRSIPITDGVELPVINALYGAITVMRPSRFAGATKGGTFTGAGQSYRRDLCHHIDYRPSGNRQSRMLVSQTDCFYVASPLNPIFMLGGAPEAHEVLSKTPRMRDVLRPKSLPRGVSDQR